MKSTFPNTKIGLLTGTVVSLAVVLYSLLSPSPGPLLPDYTGSAILFFIISTILPAISGGVISGSLIEKVIVRKLIFRKKFLLDRKTGCMIGSIVGGVLSYPVGAFLGVVVGGMFGGGIGSVIGTKIGIGNNAISIGIALGMFAVIVLITVIGAFASLLVGIAVQSVARHFYRSAT